MTEELQTIADLINNQSNKILIKASLMKDIVSTTSHDIEEAINALLRLHNIEIDNMKEEISLKDIEIKKLKNKLEEETIELEDIS